MFFKINGGINFSYAGVILFLQNCVQLALALITLYKLYFLYPEILLNSSAYVWVLYETKYLILLICVLA